MKTPKAATILIKDAKGRSARAAGGTWFSVPVNSLTRIGFKEEADRFADIYERHVELAGERFGAGR